MRKMKKRIGRLVQAVGKKPGARVLIRYTLDHRQTKKALKQRKAELRSRWSHPGARKITHISLFAVSNAGDTVLSECTRKLFEHELGGIDWNLVPMFETVTDEYVGKINRTDGIVLGGGGLFLPDTNANTASGWEWACDSKYYGRITSPLAVFAVGYNFFSGQERTRLFEDNVNALLKRADFFSLRNDGSIREVKSFTDAELAGKIRYQPCATMVARYLYPELPPKKTTGRIALNVALDRADRRLGGREETVLTQIARSMKQIAQRGYEIHFITHCDWEIRFIKYLDREKVPYRYHHATMWSAEEIIRFYHDTDMVIGMRGHGIWIPYGLNCHILTLGNHNKTRWFLEDISAMDWNVDLTQDPEHLADTICRKFTEIHEEKCEETTRRISHTQEEMWRVTCENMKEIRRLFIPETGSRNGQGQETEN